MRRDFAIPDLKYYYVFSNANLCKDRNVWENENNNRTFPWKITSGLEGSDEGWRAVSLNPVAKKLLYWYLAARNEQDGPFVKGVNFWYVGVQGYTNEREIRYQDGRCVMENEERCQLQLKADELSPFFLKDYTEKHNERINQK